MYNRAFAIWRFSLANGIYMKEINNKILKCQRQWKWNWNNRMATKKLPSSSLYNESKIYIKKTAYETTFE